MTDTIKKIRRIQAELAELIDRHERTKAWDQYQWWCNDIAETLRTQEEWIEAFMKAHKKQNESKPAQA